MARSTYYYRGRGTSEAKQKVDADLRDRLEQLALRYPRYGYRRMTKMLHREGIRVNHKRVLRIMRETGLLVKPQRRFVRTTQSSQTKRFYSNLYKTEEPRRIDEVWVADITYIRILLGFVYLAVLLDAFSRRVVGYAISRSLEARLTLMALQSALANRTPKPDCIHHSDRGSQYACDDYVALLKSAGFRISMAAKGSPSENAQIESFFKTLKTEEVYLMNYRTWEDVVERIPYFIEEVYNKDRLHSALGYQSPEEFEATLSPPLRLASG